LALEEGSETGALRFFLKNLLNLSEADRAGLTAWIEKLSQPIPDPHRGGPWKEYPRERELMVQLARLYPSDPSVIAPLYLNLIDLKPFQALYLPAGQLHGYVHGFGVELMANSDNVLRGGLTPKYVDVPELLSILDFYPLKPSILEVPSDVGTLFSYPTAVREFSLHLVRGNGKPISLEPGRPRILVLTQGSVEVRDGTGKVTPLRQGESVFIAAAAAKIELFGTFTAFVASVGAIP
jgi:mannose-6-phosphate isomerase